MSFQKDLEELLNKYSMEIGSNTPDFVLAEYLMDCYHSFNKAVNSRQQWYSRDEKPLLDTRSPTLRAPVHAEKKCPDCGGKGYIDQSCYTFSCFACDGTGISNRSAGG